MLTLSCQTKPGVFIKRYSSYDGALNDVTLCLSLITDSVLVKFDLPEAIFNFFCNLQRLTDVLLHLNTILLIDPLWDTVI